MASDGPSEELQEVEEELVSKKGESHEADDDINDIEAGQKTSRKSLWCISGVENVKVFSQVL